MAGRALASDGADVLSSVWANALGRSVRLDYGYLERDSGYPVEYFGELLWSEVDLSSSDLFGYGTFWIGIDDPNDFDADGIPDLTDPPRAAAGPRLTLSRAGAGLALEITGELDQKFELQTASALTTTPV